MNMPKRDDEVALWSAFGTNGEPHRWPRDAARELGIPHGRVAYLCQKWSLRGRYEWGTSIDLGWKLDDEQRRIHDILHEKTGAGILIIPDEAPAQRAESAETRQRFIDELIEAMSSPIDPDAPNTCG